MGEFRFTLCIAERFPCVYLCSHLVRVVKFLMPRKNHSLFGIESLYELPSDATTRIQFVIVALDDVK